jgi:hypothetical protein
MAWADPGQHQLQRKTAGFPPPFGCRLLLSGSAQQLQHAAPYNYRKPQLTRPARIMLNNYLRVLASPHVITVCMNCIVPELGRLGRLPMFKRSLLLQMEDRR